MGSAIMWQWTRLHVTDQSKSAGDNADSKLDICVAVHLLKALRELKDVLHS